MSTIEYLMIALDLIDDVIEYGKLSKRERQKLNTIADKLDDLIIELRHKQR